MRPSRAAGSRRSDRKPRFQIMVCSEVVLVWNRARTGTRGAPPQGVDRSVSARSWRRSNTTVRRSWTVAAKRSWETSRPLRTSGSMRRRPPSASAAPTAAMTTAIATKSIERWRMPQNARLPARLAGPARTALSDSFQVAHAAAACHPSSAAARTVAPHRGSRSEWLSTALDTNAAPTTAPNRAPAAAHDARDPSTSRATN